MKYKTYLKYQDKKQFISGKKENITNIRPIHLK
jgi:hypothetical protein